MSIENRPDVSWQTSAKPPLNQPQSQANPFEGTPFQGGIGSGVIIDSAGIVLTNNHVVAGGGNVVIRTHDGREFAATEVLTDPQTDIAVVKFNGDPSLVAAKIGDSEAMEVGDWVIALGQPFGLEGTVTTGIVSAKNRGIETAVAEDRFREDLYYRIHVIGIKLPPLRSRGTDVLRLAEHFQKQFSASENKPIIGLADGVAEKLLSYPWPGNVRELRNVMERAVALTRYDKITVEDLPDKIRNFKGGTVFIGGLDPAELVSMEEIERRYITHVLDATGGNQTQAARILGLDRKTIYRKLKLTTSDD